MTIGPESRVPVVVDRKGRVRPKVREYWRLLRDQENIQVGDEMNPDGKWVDGSPKSAGLVPRFHAGIFCMHRRRVTGGER